jgi:hypothetical protein
MLNIRSISMSTCNTVQESDSDVPTKYTYLRNGEVVPDEENIPPYVKPLPKDSENKWTLFKHPSAFKIKVVLILIVLLAGVVVSLGIYALYQLIFFKN